MRRGKNDDSSWERRQQIQDNDLGAESNATLWLSWTPYKMKNNVILIGFPNNYPAQYILHCLKKRSSKTDKNKDPRVMQTHNYYGRTIIIISS